MSSPELKRHLSQFFTPEAVVQFMFDLAGFNPLLNRLRHLEDKAPTRT